MKGMSELARVSAEVVARFGARGKTLGTAESLTGGMIASAVADVSGASAVLMGGVVSYDPRVKREVLGVTREVIDTVGVVSEPCARQMAEGARRVLKVDIAVSATGVAGPTGGRPKHRWAGIIGVSGPEGTRVEECHFGGDRAQVRA